MGPLQPIKTRIVRGSDYSPASELCARVRQTMTGNNPKLDLVNVDAHKKIGQILTICSQGIELTSIKGQNSVKILQKMTGNNPKLDLVNVDVHTKFGQILSIHSQYIEWKLYSDVNQGLLLRQKFTKNDRQQCQARSCQC